MNNKNNKSNKIIELNKGEMIYENFINVFFKNNLQVSYNVII